MILSNLPERFTAGSRDPALFVAAITIVDEEL